MYDKIKKNLQEKIISTPRIYKQLVVFIIDIAICIFSTVASFYLRLVDLQQHKNEIFIIAIISTLTLMLVFFSFKIYKSILRYLGFSHFLSLLKALFIYTLIFFIIIKIVLSLNIPRTIYIIQPTLVTIFIISSRAFLKMILEDIFLSKDQIGTKKKVLIYGAGVAGRKLLSILDKEPNYFVVGFIDDNKKLHNMLIDNKRIFKFDQILSLKNKNKVSLIFLAMPSIENIKKNQLLDKLSSHRIEVKSLPNISNITNNEISFGDIKNLGVYDILGRTEKFQISIKTKKQVNNKVILVTGAGGSIGSEICIQILKLNPRIILLLEVNEFSLYNIFNELEKKKKNNAITLIPVMLSIQDQSSVDIILKEWKPDIIFHAAAYKHVPLVEYNVISAIKNNIIGTKVLVELAAKHKIKNFVLISTDKAVRPTNVMGATKRVAEMILQSYHLKKSSTKFSMVRFGNVIGSSGSVIPKFFTQIRNGGPVTITDEKVTRYFMSIEEAAKLVIESIIFARGGDVFLLDMGKPVKIMDLAVKMINLCGLYISKHKNDSGIEIIVTGLRSGEKLYEELLITGKLNKTKNKKIFRSIDEFNKSIFNEKQLKKMESNLKTFKEDILIRQLEEIVTGFKTDSQRVYSNKSKIEL